MMKRMFSLLLAAMLLVSLLPTQALAASHAITVWSAEGGTVTAPASAAAGETVTLTVTPASGYFVDDIWISSANMENMEKVDNNCFTMPDYPVTIWPSFELASGLSYDVKLHWDHDASKGSVSFDKTTAVCGETITVTVTPAAGYMVSDIIVYWTNADGKEAPVTRTGNTGTFSMPDDDATVQIIFEEGSAPETTTHTVTVPGEITGGSITVDKATAAEGETVAVTATPAEGYKVDTITYTYGGNSYPVTDGKFTMPASDVTVSATFTLDQTGTPTTYAVNVATGIENGTVTVNPTTAAAGTEVAVTATPAQGYEVEAITYTDGTNTVTVTGGKFTMPASDVTVSATFTLDQTGTPTTYAVNVATGIENGTVSVDPTTAAAGTEVAVTATPAEGYKMDTITYTYGGNSYPVTDSKFNMPASDVTVSATFTLDQTATPTTYNVTVADGISNGTVTVNPTTAEADAEITVTATPAQGYEVEAITYTDGTNTVTVTGGKFIMPASNVTVSATFKALPTTYNITLDPVTGASVNLTANMAAEGEQITVTVTPMTGYELVSITAVDAKGDNVTVTDSVFTMPGSNVTVTVIMKALEGHFGCTLTADNWKPLTQTSGTLPAGSYYLTGDLTLTGPLTVSGTVNLCLNGHTLRGNGTNSALKISGGILNLADCGDGGKITGANSSEDGTGLGINVSSGTVNMYGGSITDNISKNYGTVYVNNSGIFNMYGGSVSGNRLVNSGTYGGGAFYVRGSLNVYGGSITGNNANNQHGGGIYCSSYGTVKLYGGTISGNSTTGNGDGIFYSCREANGSELYIGGSPNIVDDIYLDYGSVDKYPYITSTIKNDLTLTVTNPSEGRIVAKGTSSYTLTTADLARITLNAGSTPYYCVLDETNNRIIMSTTDPGYTANYFVQYYGNGASSGSVNDDTPYNASSTGAVIKANGFTWAGRKFLGWNTKADGTGIFYQPGDHVAITENLNLYAIWSKEDYKVIVVPAENGTITVNHTDVNAGDVITVTAEPATGYKLKEIIVKDAAGQDVALTEGEFTVPASNVTVSAIFEAEVVKEVLVFNYGYDVQRSPAFPSKGGTVSVSGLAKPVGSGGRDDRRENAGDWKLTKLGLYSATAYPGTSSVMSGAATAYKVAPETLYVYELTLGTEHIAYGVLSMYNPTEHVAIFVGDSIGGSGAGYLFSNVSQTAGQEFDSTFDATDELDTKDYTIDVTAGQGGTATAPAKAKKGTEITVTTTPDQGKIVDTITVKDAQDNAVPVTNGKFTMPASNVTVTVTFTDDTSYTITDEQTGNGSGSYQVEKDAAGETFTVPAEPGRGCRVEIIVTDKNGNVISPNAQGSYDIPAADVHVEVKFIKNDYGVSAEEKTGGEIGLKDNISTYHYDDLVEVSVDVEPGYELTHLYVVRDLSNRLRMAPRGATTEEWDIASTMQFRMPDYHVKLVPVFNKITHTLTVTANKSTVTVDGEKGATFTLDDGATPEITIKADRNYFIKKVTLNGETITSKIKDGKLILDAVHEDLELVVTTQKEAASPYTGDDFRFHAWLFVMVCSALTVVRMMIPRRKGKYSR